MPGFVLAFHPAETELCASQLCRQEDGSLERASEHRQNVA